jgi:hypothetical protein
MVFDSNIHIIFDITLTDDAILENIVFDHGSSVPLNDQAKQGMALISKYCLELLLEVQTEHQIRVIQAKDERIARIAEEMEAKRRKEVKERLKVIEVSEN